MEILLLLGIYVVELLCYQVVLRMLFQVNVTTKKWMILGGGLPIIIEMLPVNMAGKNFFVTFAVIGISYVSIEGNIINKGIRLVLTLIFLECIDDIFLYSCEKIFIKEFYVGHRHIICLSAKCLTFISVCVLNYLKEKFKKFKITHINSVIYLVIGVFILLMLFCLGILNQAIIYFPNDRYILLCKFLNIAIIISIFLLVVFVIYIKNTNERMEQLLKTERLLKESQVNYYKQILKKEADTRQYRHDMVNHLVYIQETLRRNQIIQATQYLANILGGFRKIQSTYYVTGNEMVDTIMNYFIGMLPDNVNIEIRGKCPVIIDVKDTDICTIFSNIFQNAIEEIEENKIKNAHLIIEVCKGQQYVEYKIRNSLSLQIDEKSINKYGLPKSHKLDKRNHGIGMINMKTAIEKYHGKFEWKQEKGYFCVRVILPIKL